MQVLKWQQDNCFEFMASVSFAFRENPNPLNKAPPEIEFQLVQVKSLTAASWGPHP